MDVLKRSEFCGVSKVNKAGLVTKLGDIKTGTVFNAHLGGYTSAYTWMRTNNGCVRMESKGTMNAGYHCVPGSGDDCSVCDYEVLNATLVIDD